MSGHTRWTPVTSSSKRAGDSLRASSQRCRDERTMPSEVTRPRRSSTIPGRLLKTVWGCCETNRNDGVRRFHTSRDRSTVELGDSLQQHGNGLLFPKRLRQRDFVVQASSREEPQLGTASLLAWNDLRTEEVETAGD